MFEQFTEEYFMEQAREMGDSYGVEKEVCLWMLQPGIVFVLLNL